MWNPSRSLKLGFLIYKTEGSTVYPLALLLGPCPLPFPQSIGLCFPLTLPYPPSMPTVCVCPVLCDSRDCGPSASFVCGIFRARILEQLPFPPPGDCPHPGIKPTSLALAGGFLTTEAAGKPRRLVEPLLFVGHHAKHLTSICFYISAQKLPKIDVIIILR